MMRRKAKSKESKEKITCIANGTVIKVTNCVGKSWVGTMDGCTNVLGHIILKDGVRLAFGRDAILTEVPIDTPLSVCDYVIERDRFWDVISGEQTRQYKGAYHGE